MAGASPGMTASYPHEAICVRFSPPPLQRVADLVQHLRILDGGGHRPWVAVGDLLDGAAQDFAGARLRQPRNRDRELERRDGTEFFAYQRHDLLFDLRMASGKP